MIFAYIWQRLGMRAQLPGDERKRRKSHLLGIFLGLTLLLCLGLVIVNIIELLVSLNVQSVYYLLEDVLVVALVLGMISLNRLGHVRVTAYLFLLFFLAGIPSFITSNWLPYFFLFYTIPILASSFILSPRASLWVLGVSFLTYLGAQAFIIQTDYAVSFVSLGILAFLAVSAWWVAERLEQSIDESHRTEQKYLTLVEKNPYCVYSAEGSQAGRWIYVNSRIEDLLGYSAEEWLAAPTLWHQRVHPLDREKVLADIQRSLSAGQPYHGEYRLLHRSGQVVWVSDFATPAETSEPGYVQGVLTDITAARRTELIHAATYRISEAAFAADELDDLYRQIHGVLGELMHAENFFIALYDAATDMLTFPYFVDQYDAPPEPVLARHGLTEFVLRTGEALFATQEICAQMVARGEISDIGTPSVDWLGVPLMLNGRAIGVMATQSYVPEIRFLETDLDILKFVSTQVAMVIERKRNEAELREVNQLTSEVISGVNTGIIVLDQNRHFQIWNRYMEQMTGLSPDMVFGKSTGDIFPFLRRPNYQSLLTQALLGQTVAIPDIEYVLPLTGKEGWMSGYCGPHRDAQGEIIGIIAVINDITERKNSEKALHSALAEKEILLREIHHRVKNNLQVMSSLISLQVETISDQAARSLFMEMQGRVRSMGLVHEELYQSDNLSQVNFAEYIGKLAGGLKQTFAINPNVSLNVDVEEVFLGVDTAIPCGLIINELVTNAFKYAFPGERSGEVTIRLRSGAENQYILEVCDDGVGISPAVDIENTETLGMQLITILTRQLRGTLQVSLLSGTSFQVMFRETKPGQRK